MKKSSLEAQKRKSTFCIILVKSILYSARDLPCWYSTGVITDSDSDRLSYGFALIPPW